MRRWRRVDWLYFDLPAARPGSLNAYLIATLISLVALLARIAIDPWIHGVQFVTYYPAIILVALLCGFGAGFFSVALAVLLSWYFIVQPRGSFALENWESLFTLALFGATTAVIVYLIGTMRLAIGRYRLLSASLRRRVEQSAAELKSTQANLVQAQKMEVVGQLTGGIAHDFNNMLAVVIGNLDIAHRRMKEGRSDVIRQIENARDGAERAAALTQRLLVFARRQPLEPAVIDLNRLIGELGELLRRTLGETIRIESSLARDIWPISADPSQLESAVINLAINARDAMGGAGTLSIATFYAEIPEYEHVAASGLTPGDYVIVSIADTGAGMSPDVAARAIEPFFTTKEVGRGTGLGLSQVYGFVRQSGGHLEIDSREGVGTTVRLYFPRHEGEGPADRDEAANGHAVPRGSPGEVILVVEDEDQVRRTTIDGLTELGYAVREARSGVEALAILASDLSIALLFTDVVMPGLDGRQLAERALRQRPDLKILYTTGYAPESGAVPSFDGDHPALLQKPFNVGQLARKVREMLDS